MNKPKVIYLHICGECQDNDCEKCNFDYRGLIDKGLALEASKDMYK